MKEITTFYIILFESEVRIVCFDDGRLCDLMIIAYLLLVLIDVDDDGIPSI